MQEVYKIMEERNVVMAFKGDLSHKTATSILSLVKKILECTDLTFQSKKKLYSIVAESMDNITSNNIFFEQNQLPDKYRSSILCLSEHAEHFIIQTGNYILNTQIRSLKQKLEAVNLLNREELKALYLERLLESNPQGGGLGIIDISIRSGCKLNYEFVPYSNKISFFILKSLLRK